MKLFNWFRKKKEVIEEVEKVEPKFNQVKYEVDFKIDDTAPWLFKAEYNIKPITKEEFTEKIKNNLLKKIKKDILSKKISLVADNAYMKGYSFKKVKWFTVRKSSLELEGKNG